MNDQTSPATYDSPLEAEVVEPAPQQPARPPQRRRVRLPLILFFATCLTTYSAGTRLAGFQASTQEQVQAGLVYMAAVLAILFTHEMGHFLQAVRYHVPASLPFFIPLPIGPLGTLGAVIGMQGNTADRKQMFDIGISGPIAGLVVALPILWFAVESSPVIAESPDQIVGAGEMYGDPLLLKIMFRIVRPEVPAGAVFTMTPLMMAGWVGLFVTGLNMLPVSQLDGGHVAYALFGRNAHLLARGIIIISVIAMILFDLYSWILILMIVLLIGTDHPPTRDDSVPLGLGRRILGFLSLGIPILCLTPVPITFT